MDMETLAATAKKILVVDDDPVVLKAMSLMLSAKGYQVLTAESGADAISVLGRNKPHLMLLDLDFPPDPSTPLVDGFLTLEWARRFGIAHNVPVIIVSSLDPAAYQKRAEAAGIEICLRKPVNERTLQSAIQTALARQPGA